MEASDDLHLVVFTDTYFETNGIGSYYRTLLDWCRPIEGVRITVVCPKSHEVQVASNDDNVIQVPSLIDCRNPFYRDLRIGYFFQRPLRKIVKSLTGQKVVHIATAGPLGMAGARMARNLNLPVVGCYHTDLNHYASLYGKSVFGPPGAWLGAKVALWCDKLSYGRCDAICAPSRTAEKTVGAFFKGATKVIPNPVDVKRFRPAQSRSGRFRSNYCTNGRVLVIVVGRVAREKNLDLICELLGRDNRVQPVFVGDGPYAPALKKRWGAKVTGFLRGQELVEAYQQADVFVQLSVSETFGLSFVEALACGLPALVLRSQGLAGSMTPESGVEVLEREDLPTLADRCVSLVLDGERYCERSRRVREFALQLGPDVVLPEFIEFHRACAR